MSAALMTEHPSCSCFCCVGDPDDVLSKVLTTMVELGMRLERLTTHCTADVAAGSHGARACIHNECQVILCQPKT